MTNQMANINVLEGKLVADGINVGIVASRFNEFIVSKLISGALDGLLRRRCEGRGYYAGIGSGGF